MEGEETRTKSRTEDETGVMRVGSETICDRQKSVMPRVWPCIRLTSTNVLL